MAEDNRTCAKCGAMIENGATLCGLCGTPAGNSQADSRMTPAEPNDLTHEDQEYERQKAQLLARMSGSAAVQTELAPEAKTKTKRQSIMLAAAAALVILVSCATFAGVVAIKNYRLNTSDKPKMAQLMDHEMRALAANDTDTALTYFAADSYKTITELSSFVKESNKEVFAAYGGLTITKVISFSLLPKADEVATAEGKLNYNDGCSGTFTTVYKRENGQWKLINFILAVQPAGG